MTRNFLAINQLSLVVRSHECVGEGYKFHQDGLCVTVFSAAGYCSDDNRGAVLRFREGMKPEPQQVKAVKYGREKPAKS